MIRLHDRITLSFGATDTEKTSTISGINGVKSTIMAVVAIADWTNIVTLTYAHILPTTALVYSIGTLAKNQPITAPVVLLYERPFYNGCIIKATLSNQPGGSGGNITIDLFVED
jgi:hypothetical protein